MSIETDFSYGIIPVRKIKEEWQVFLICQYSKIGSNTYWIFPKGHSYLGETPKDTAQRELKEETGFELNYLVKKPSFSLNYHFNYDGKRINKTVKFFVGVVGDKKPTLHPEEVKEAGWYDLNSAMERLDYTDTKQMFIEVKNFLESKKLVIPVG
jgi:bis(5'-nucleosidyl)-tetraphosphatase